jgi:chemotaxis protein CheD
MMAKSKFPAPNHEVLPMEFAPRLSTVLDEKHAKRFLMPGHLVVCAKPTAITAIVGSGVSLCLWDSLKGIGGANHVLMPEGTDQDQNVMRYANLANEALLRQLLELGASLPQLKARLFGGSQPLVTFGNSEDCLGNRNVEVGLNFLRDKGIRIAEKEVGGTRARKVIFQTDDGRAWSQQI